MEEREDDNIYVYTEPSESTDSLDDSGPNYAQAENVSQEAAKTEEKNEKRDKRDVPNPFHLLFKVMLNPVEGWKSVRRSKITAEEIQVGCFYPLVALLAVSQFVEMIYSSRISLSTAVENAVFAFVSFFFGYFLIVILLRVIMPRLTTKSIEGDFGKVFVLVNLSTLCMFFTLTQLLPMLWAILIFLPLWTVYLISRGTRFFVFPHNRQITCTAVLCLLIVGIPMFLGWILEKLLPSV
ncbi:MAG: hypothetical protein K2O49_09340 [Muribaculaceae bacterium]|nr:hypothetical protein [Muribaculaceae bacterium]